MDKKPASRKSSPARVILITVAALATTCVVAGIAIYAFFILGTLSRMPKVSTQGIFENSTYTAPNANFACKFPWHNVEGETLTDGLDESSGWVKYKNDFGVNIAVEYISEQDGLLWPQSRREQIAILDSLFDKAANNFRSQALNVTLIHSEHRDIPGVSLFSVIKYQQDQDDPSLLIRGDLFFFEGSHYYIITYGAYEWSPLFRNVRGEEWK